MRFVSFASSSKGNAALITYKDTNILIDCGISRKRLVGELSIYGLTLKDIDAILVTHEHDDHIMGLPGVLKDNKIKVMSQRETLIKIVDYCENKGTKIDTSTFKIAHPVNASDENTYITIKDIKVYPIKGSHDVASVCYKMVLGDTKVAIVTDIGNISDYVLRSLSDVEYMMLECNYDIERMIETTRYPAFLKSRIMSDKGHLSNVQCAEAIIKLASGMDRFVYLSHISEITNSEEYAIDFVTRFLQKNYNGDKKLPSIRVSRRIEKTVIIDKE